MTSGAPVRREIELLVVGDCNPDLVLSGNDLSPEFGQVEKLADTGDLLLGGSGAITACQAAKLGVPTAFVGVVGDDPLGAWCLESLESSGVDVSGCTVESSAPTGVTVVLSQGENRAMITHRGAIALLESSRVPLDLLSAARHVHFSAYFLNGGLAPGLPALSSSVRRRGGTTSLDPNWDPSGEWDSGVGRAIDAVDLFFANEQEIEQIAAHWERHGSEATPGGSDGGAMSAERAAGMLGGAGTTVVVKRGERGALLVSGPVSRTVTHPLGPADVLVDSTGAGDSFDAGFIAGRLSGLSVPDCLLLACFCGMRTVTALGGTAGQPTGDQVLKELGLRL